MEGASPKSPLKCSHTGDISQITRNEARGFIDQLGALWYFAGAVRGVVPRSSVPMPEFQPGDKAVYPGHGVAEVTGKETRDLAGFETEGYLLEALGKDMTLFVPMNNVGRVGLRRLVDDEQVSQVYDVLRRRDEKISTATWNRRHREYMEKIKTGSLLQIASVLRDLCILRSGKELSYGEKNMLETARGLLVQELALAKDQSEEDIAREIDQMFEN